MPQRPSVFDADETLSVLSPSADRFPVLGVPGSMATSGLAALLRDGVGHCPSEGPRSPRLMHLCLELPDGKGQLILDPQPGCS